MNLLTRATSWLRGEPDWNELGKHSKAGAKTPQAPVAKGFTSQVHGQTVRRINHRDARRRVWTTDRAIRYGLQAATAIPIAIHKRAEALADVPMRVGRMQGGSFVPDTTGEFADIARLLEEPNPEWPWPEFAYRAWQHWLLTGNALVKKVYYTTRSGVAHLWLFGPHGVKPIAGDSEPTVAYERSPGTSPNDRVEARRIIHIQLPDPRDPRWGISPLELAARSVDSLESAEIWQRYSYRNGASPSGILSVKHDLEEDSAKAWREAMRDDLSGPHNAGKLALIENADEVDLKIFGFNAREMDFLESTKASRNDVLAIYQVSPHVAGYLENATYNNIAAAHRLFEETVVESDAKMFARQLSHGLRREYGRDFVIMPDFSKRRFGLERLEQQAGAAEKLSRAGFSKEEIVEMLSLDVRLTDDVSTDQEARTLQLVQGIGS